MPRHGQLWWWSDEEQTRAVLMLAHRCGSGTFTMADIHDVNHAITMVRIHGAALRNALLMTGRIEAVDRSNPRKYRYRVKAIDGQQAQRPAPSAD